MNGADVAAERKAGSGSRAGLHTARVAARVALWTACGVAIAGVERLLPTPLPWVRLGLANGAALIVLYGMGWQAALTVNVMRSVVIAALFGTWAGPSFALSLSGGIVAVAVMALVKWLARGTVGPVGVSAVGAFAHMLVQFSLAAALFVRSGTLLVFAGPSLIAAVVSGVLVGLIAQVVMRRLPLSLIRGE